MSTLRDSHACVLEASHQLGGGRRGARAHPRRTQTHVQRARRALVDEGVRDKNQPRRGRAALRPRAIWQVPRNFAFRSFSMSEAGPAAPRGVVDEWRRRAHSAPNRAKRGDRAHLRSEWGPSESTVSAGSVTLRSTATARATHLRDLLHPSLHGQGRSNG